VRWGFVAAFSAIAIGGISDADDLWGWLAAAGFGAWAVFAAFSAVRERVEISADRVRVVRLLTETEVERTDVAHVGRSAGRGRPAHLALAAGAARPTRDLVLDRRPGRRTIDASLIALPPNMTAARAAAALGLPLTTFGGTPIEPDAWRHELEGWYRRPFIWSCIVLVAIVVALTVWGLFWGPPS
jgi:hypothetical protein